MSQLALYYLMKGPQFEVTGVPSDVFKLTAMASPAGRFLL